MLVQWSKTVAISDSREGSHMRRFPSRSLFIAFIVVTLSSSLYLAPVGAWGDAGGYSGSSNYGGSSSSSGGWSSSSGSGSWGGSGSSYSSSGFDDPIETIVIAAIVITIFLIMGARNRHRKDGSGIPGQGHQGQPAGAMATDRSRLRPVSDLLATDPGFREADLTEQISNTYVKMQNAWTAGDFEPMRPYFSDGLYAQFDRQLAALKQRGLVNYVDNIAVLGVTCEGWYEDEMNECMVATVRTRIIDYTVDTASGSVVSGHRDVEKFMTYEYILTRPRGTVTAGAAGETHAVSCPNCAAALDINKTTRCPYCGSIVTVEEHGWVISEIKGISQQTMG